MPTSLTSLHVLSEERTSTSITSSFIILVMKFIPVTAIHLMARNPSSHRTLREVLPSQAAESEAERTQFRGDFRNDVLLRNKLDIDAVRLQRILFDVLAHSL